MKDHSKAPFVERAIISIGSVPSIVIHTALFAAAFLLAVLGIIAWEMMLLVLTTVVSLEAIYMAIFIQIAVNRNTEQLREVEQDIDEIQEDVEELGEDLEDIQEDIEEIQEDVEEMTEEEEEEERQRQERRQMREKREQTEAEVLAHLTNDIQRVLAELEALKGKK